MNSVVYSYSWQFSVLFFPYNVHRKKSKHIFTFIFTFEIKQLINQSPEDMKT